MTIPNIFTIYNWPWHLTEKAAAAAGFEAEVKWEDILQDLKLKIAKAELPGTKVSVEVLVGQPGLAEASRVWSDFCWEKPVGESPSNGSSLDGKSMELIHLKMGNPK